VTEQREQPHPFQIVRYKPSDLKDEDYQRLGLVDLQRRGYGTLPNGQNGLDHVREEFGGDDARKDIFLATEDGKAISALILINWSEDQQKRGEPFWKKLRERAPEIAAKAQAYSTYACDIGGTVTLPEHRGRGLMKELIQKAQQELKPSVIVGRTKTVEAVNSRVNTWKGMTSFYGRNNVTPGARANDADIAQALDASYFFARRPEEVVDEYGFCYVSSNVLPSTIPDVSQMPENIQVAFQSVINRQRQLNEANEETTALQPLISIVNEALK